MNRKRLLVAVGFFLSGFAALVYQIAWQRMLTRLTGATLPAVSITFGAFLGGLGVGSLVSAGRIPKIRNPLWAYAWLEAALGIGGLAFPALCRYAIEWAHQWAGSLNASDSLYACLYTQSALLVFCPALLMGATLPLVSQFVSQDRDEINASPTIGAMYAINTSGAVIGAVCGAFFLIPHIGLSNAVYAAAAVNFAVAGIIGNAARLASSGKEPAPPVVRPPAGGFDVGTGAGIVMLSALVSAILEVGWSRLFMLVLGSSTYALGAVLSTFLGGLALGAWRFNQAASRLHDHMSAIGAIAAATFVLLWIELLALNNMPWLLFELQRTFFALAGTSFAAYLSARFFLVALFVLPVTFLLGGVFPFAVHGFSGHANEAGKNVGHLYFASTLGSVVGSLMAGFVLIPGLHKFSASGIQGSLCTATALEAILAALAFFLVARQAQRAHAKRPLRAWVLADALSLLAVIALFVRPTWDLALMSAGVSFLELPKNISRDKFVNAIPGAGGVPASDGSGVIYYRDGLNTTVTVEQNRAHNVVFLKNDGKVEAALPGILNQPSPSSDLPTHVLLGLLPALWLPHTTERALIIGYGSGATCGALLKISQVQKILVAELESAVIDADRFFAPANNSPRQDKERCEILNCDGRNLLNTLNHKFQLIISQPPEPWINGAADLYTVEFWKLARTRLTADGAFCQWIQLYGVDKRDLLGLLRGFSSVFPDTFIFQPGGGGEIILVGLMNPSDRLNLKSLSKRMTEPLVAEELSRIGIHNQHDILSTVVATPASLDELCRAHQAESSPLNTDDRLVTEYALPARLFAAGSTIEENEKLLRSIPANLSAYLHH